MLTKDQIIDGLLTGWNELGDVTRHRYVPSEWNSFEEFLQQHFGEEIQIKGGDVPDQETDILSVWSGDEHIMFRDTNNYVEPDFMCIVPEDELNLKDVIHVYLIKS